eukprot:CAMPEP_0115519678 /NCGR_PEP_ID=MMETSP0271-20121206/78561_1 /TAXON_ID=71861 /ORGANISM="Scrippsiella trochoidea, Strain CCMP3099" /LENGTH=154 /DNA_ID=CAMNT_0002950699 /DNA_START=193 /DNA_END=656 /DNA_ORIENTATION=+
MQLPLASLTLGGGHAFVRFWAMRRAAGGEATGCTRLPGEEGAAGFVGEPDAAVPVTPCRSDGIPWQSSFYIQVEIHVPVRGGFCAAACRLQGAPARSVHGRHNSWQLSAVWPSLNSRLLPGMAAPTRWVYLHEATSTASSSGRSHCVSCVAKFS